jgi:hypothetical protein
MIRVVPDPVLADSWPVASVRVTVMVSFWLTASASATLMPVIGV